MASSDLPARQQPDARHLGFVARGDAPGVFQFERGGVARVGLAQPAQDLLGFERAVGAQLDQAHQHQRVWLARIDQQRLVEDAARHVGAVLGFPHARRGQQLRQLGRGFGGLRGLLGQRRRCRHRRHRGGAEQCRQQDRVQRAGHPVFQAGSSAPSRAKRYWPSR
jgi:hypothetical protein